jgi:DNA-binding CsgD family transcriptional regulator
MRPRPAAEPKHDLPPKQHAGPCTDDLFRALVESVSQSLGLPLQEALDARDEKPEQVILDTELDGSRYLLIRQSWAREPRVQLSPREQEIVRMVAEGHPNKVIAAVLNISSWTVCTHLRRIFAKLGVGSRAAMVARLLEQGSMSSLAQSVCDSARVRPASPGGAARLSHAPEIKSDVRRRDPIPRRAS